MIIYPAIDLRGGKVVRLREGDPKQQTVFSDNPSQTAETWRDAGAEWLHVVNLDGAFNQANNNQAILSIIADMGVKVQFGGGMRSIHDIEEALNRGASRVVVGTLALTQPHIVAEAIERFGQEALCIALDARDDKVTTHGWTEVSDMSPVTLGLAMRDVGIKHALFTDVSRDGGLEGSNLKATIALGRHTGLAVIASGGVTQLDEIEELAKSGVVAGAVIGMALYTGAIELEDALRVAQSAGGDSC